MRLWLDPGRLAARRITAGDVVNALREQNVQVAAGSIGEAPAREDQGYQISVRAAGRLQEARDFEEHRRQSRRRRLARQAQGCCADRARRRAYHAASLSGNRRRRPGGHSTPDGERTRRRGGGRRRARTPGRAFPARDGYRVAFNTTTVVRESIREVLKPSSKRSSSSCS